MEGQGESCRCQKNAKTGMISVKLRELLTFSAKHILNQLKLDNCVIQGVVSKDEKLN